MQKKNIKITKQFKEKKLSTVLNSKILNKKLIETNSDEDEFSKLKSKMVKCKKLNETIMDNCMSKSTLESSKSKKTVNEEVITPVPVPESKCTLSTKTKNVLDAILFRAREKKEKPKENREMKISERTRMILENSMKKRKSGKGKEKEKEGKKSKEPKLSLKTLKIIDRLSRTRKNRFDNDNEEEEETISSFRTESSFTNLRLKYSDLLNMELRLPTKYKVLMEKFKMLESAISINKINDRSGNNYLSAIKKSIESSTYKSFDLKVFQQILYVVPHFYIYKYKKSREEDEDVLMEMFGQKNYDLMIDIPFDYKDRIKKEYPPDFNFLSINFVKESDFFNASPSAPSPSESSERLKLFKGILTRLTNEAHSAFLAREQIRLRFDPLRKHTWHHSFDVETCPDVPLFEIPSAPKSVNVFQKEVEEDIKSEVLEGALELVKEEEAARKDRLNKGKIQENGLKQTTLNKYMSSELLQRLRAKEIANSVNNEIMEYNRTVHGKKDRSKVYIEIMRQIKTICIMNNKSMRLREIAEMIRNNSASIRSLLPDEDSLCDVIEKISKKYQGFFRVLPHSSLGRVLVLEGRSKSLPREVSLDDR